MWRGRWVGPPADLQLRFDAQATVDTMPKTDLKQDPNWIGFAATPGMEITVTVIGTHAPDPSAYAMLVEVTPVGERIPPWERIDPVGGEETLRE